MGNSLQDYRLQIGLFIGSTRSRSRNKNEKWRENHYTFKIKMTLILMLMCLVANMSSRTPISKNQTSNSSHYQSCQSFPLRTYQVQVYKDNPPYPGGQVGKMNNFWARYVYGNRSRGIKLCHWNIGGGYLCNKMDTIRNLIEDYTPHILGISEASFKSDHSLDDVNIPKYKVFFSKTLKNPQLNVSRVAVYVSEDINAAVRNYLKNDEFSSVWIEVGLSRQKKFLVSHIYGDWQ